MAFIKINHDKVSDAAKLVKLCPFNAIEINDAGQLSINSGCRMCKLCVKKSNGIFELAGEEKSRPRPDRNIYRDVAVLAEIDGGSLHPVSLELLGKARELAQKSNAKVLVLLPGKNAGVFADTLIEYGADAVFVYENDKLEYFLAEPFAAVMEDFIRENHVSVFLVGGTPAGRALAPRLAARFRTGLTADCTFLDVSEDGDLEQIRPAYGGNIMAHINTLYTRPQFATVRYKIFPIPEKVKNPSGKVFHRSLPEEKYASAAEIIGVFPKKRENSIEDAEIIVAAGRGIKKKEDLAMLEELAGLLGGTLASSRPLVECSWMDPRRQIGLSGRTVKPKLLIACGISGAIQFVAGMNGAEKIIAINSDPEAPIFKAAHVAICGDIYKVVPELIAKIRGEAGK